MEDKGVYMVIDLDRCWGCRACEVACKQEKGLEVGFSPMKIVEIQPRKIAGKLHRDFVPTLCQHCVQAYCLEACPEGAISRGEDGTIQIDDNSCLGCELCVSECPYGFIHVSAAGKVIKCDLCIDRRKSGRLPSCVQHCPGRALTWVVSEKEMNEVVGNKYFWKTGRMVYVSEKWASLGEEIKGVG